ncbi:MAG: hypothetical protein M3Y24_04535 [Acidobacteriota bacterium]|nr:hypothetical protein [Acidobacteriota bacterium]
MAAPQPSRIQTLEEIAALVTGAVFLHKPISAIYNDCRRSLCPHILGKKKGGTLQVLCYQYAGESVSGLKRFGSADNWRCIAVAKLREVRLLDERWVSAENHSRPQTCIEEVLFDAEKLPER